jgi:ADP-ribose pyrophosphatase YjhB (NUDIX family)
MPLNSPPQKTQVIRGDRVGRQGRLRLGCSLVLLSPDRKEVLLTRRSDNGQWCLPGGTVDPGESVTETCMREMREETSLEVRLVRLTGVYSDPDQLVIYPDGNKAFIVVLNFEVEQIGGRLQLSPETTEARFFSVEEAMQMDLFHNHAEHLRDALEGNSAAFIR